MPATLQSVNGLQVASLNGTLDSISGADLVTTIRTSADKNLPLILDFAMVPQMDARGLKHLLELNQTFQHSQRRLVLASMNSDVWRLMEESSITDKFETFPSREAAMIALRGKPAPAAAPADDFSSFDMESGVVPEVESAIFDRVPPSSTSSASFDDWSAPAPATSASASWASSGDSDGWEKYNKSVPAKDPSEKNPSKNKLYIAIAAGVVLLTLGIFWLVGYLKAPEIRVSETLIEVQEGQELPEVSIWVVDGELDFEDIRLPQGVEFTDSEQTPTGLRYFLVGLPKAGGSYPISLHASRGSRKSLPVEINIEVKEKKLEWLFTQPPMEENTPINKSHYTKVVNGAASLQLRWVGEALNGLEVHELEGTRDVWQITGTPAKGGEFQAEFIATTKSGREEKKIYTLQVKKAPVLPTLPKPEPPPSPGPTSDPIPTPPGPVPPPPPLPPPPPEKNDGMRTFLMERIEKANNHFTDSDKALLREIVARLKEARLVKTVEFGVNKTSLSSSESTELKQILRKPDIAKLLDDKDCQILIVGYASTTGSHARNVKLSQQRAKAVNAILQDEIKRSADLCGDYGPTDIISSKEAGNRVVEIYIGTIEISKTEQVLADMFKKDFNRRHGGER